MAVKAVSTRIYKNYCAQSQDSRPKSFELIRALLSVEYRGVFPSPGGGSDNASWVYKRGTDTLWLFNIAMENHNF